MISQSPKTYLKLRDKVALITGSGQGMGEAISYEFSREGAKIVVVDIIPKRGQKVVENIKKNKGTAIFVKTDVTNVDSIKECVSKVLKKYKTIDILINCVGYNKFTAIEEVTEEYFDKLITLNLNSQWYVSNAVIPIMIKNKSGKIVNIASGGGVLGIPKALPYSTAKAGVLGLTRSMAIDLGPYNINVNCIAPGNVINPASFESTNKAFRDKALERIPLPRLGSASDVAKAALFLSSSSSDWITGVILPVDGGLLCCLRGHHIE